MKIDEDEGVKPEDSNADAEDNVKVPTPNPLEKYMRIIQQRREEELATKVMIILKTVSQKY